MKININLIKKRLNSATPGPWVASVFEGNKDLLTVKSRSVLSEHALVCMASHNDAEFIAHCHDDLNFLLKENEFLKTLLYTAIYYGNLEFSHDPWCAVFQGQDPCNCWIAESKSLLFGENSGY